MQGVPTHVTLSPHSPHHPPAMQRTDPTQPKALYSPEKPTPWGDTRCHQPGEYVTPGGGRQHAGALLGQGGTGWVAAKEVPASKGDPCIRVAGGARAGSGPPCILRAAPQTFFRCGRTLGKSWGKGRVSGRRFPPDSAPQDHKPWRGQGGHEICPQGHRGAVGWPWVLWDPPGAMSNVGLPEGCGC